MTSSSPFLRVPSLLGVLMSTLHTFPVFASALWTVKLLYKSTCMNHFETHFSFTQLRRKHTKGQCVPALSPISFSPGVSFVFFLILTPLSSILPLTPSCLTFLSLYSVTLTVSVSHVSPQLWRTAGSSWWISLTTNCGCLCPMCHSPTRDATCASSTRILLRKPTQTSLSWVGVRVHVWKAPTYHTLPYTLFFLFHPFVIEGEYEIMAIFDPVIFSNWNKMSAN